jgi:hypothetical protein
VTGQVRFGQVNKWIKKGERERWKNIGLLNRYSEVNLNNTARPDQTNDAAYRLVSRSRSINQKAR